MMNNLPRSTFIAIIITVCTVFLASCSSFPKKPASVQNDKLWSQGFNAYQILEEATSDGDFKKLASREEDVLVTFLNTYHYNSDTTPYGPTIEQKVIYDVGSAYDNFKLAINNAADSMDRFNGRMDALRYINELHQFYNGQ